MDKLRVGVIGTGSMGRNHVRVAAESPDCELVGIADTNSERISELAGSYACNGFSDYRFLLEKKPDLAVIAVPTSLHKAVAMDAIGAGANVLVEKPIATTVEDGVSLCEAAAKSGKKLFVGHIERFNPAVTAAKRVLGEGSCGEVLSISNLRIGLRNVRILDTGIILDLGTHDIDLISHLLGERAFSVYTIAFTKFGSYEDHACIMLNFGSGKSGIIETCWLMPYKVRKVFVTGEEGFLLLDLIEQKVALLHEKFVSEVPVEKAEPLKLQLASIVDSIRNGKAPFVDGENSTYVLAAAQAAIRSFKGNIVVEIPDLRAV